METTVAAICYHLLRDSRREDFIRTDVTRTEWFSSSWLKTSSPLDHEIFDQHSSSLSELCSTLKRRYNSRSYFAHVVPLRWHPQGNRSVQSTSFYDRKTHVSSVGHSKEITEFGREIFIIPFCRIHIVKLIYDHPALL